jgi:hypothetical protein
LDKQQFIILIENKEIRLIQDKKMRMMEVTRVSGPRVNINLEMYN